jgi:hypothetical protein
LALGWAFRYGAPVIGVLRFVGVLNAAVWFGAAVCFTFAGVPGIASREMQTLLGTNYPYYSEAIGHIISARFFRVQLFCALIAVLYLTGEWLYLGKYPRRLWLGLLLGLCSVCLINGFWLQPKLNELHVLRYGLKTPPPQRQVAADAFMAWHNVSVVLNLISVAGLGIYFWRMVNPPDPTRFMSAVKFRS